MTDPSVFMRSVDSSATFTASAGFLALPDECLQAVEGGYFKCTLCDAMLPGEHHVAMHLEGRLHKRNVANISSHPQTPSYMQQYVRQFFEDNREISFGVVGKDQAPVHWAADMRCELCEATLLCFDTWVMHIVGKKHQKARRNSVNRLFWQKLHADFPYFYEHISGMWQTAPPRHGHLIKGDVVTIVGPLV